MVFRDPKRYDFELKGPSFKAAILRSAESFDYFVYPLRVQLPKHEVYIPQAIITIPNTETIDTPYLGTFGPLGIPRRTQVLPRDISTDQELLRDQQARRQKITQMSYCHNISLVDPPRQVRCTSGTQMRHI